MVVVEVVGSMVLVVEVVVGTLIAKNLLRIFFLNPNFESS
jgi:hypothetical protein